MDNIPILVKIYIPVGEDTYNTHQAFEIERTSDRYNPNKVRESVSSLPKDTILATFYEYPEPIFFKFGIPTSLISEPKQQDNMK
jgi:hypothetical protein